MNQPLTTSSLNHSVDAVTSLCPTHGQYEATVMGLGIDGIKPILSRCPTCKREHHAAFEERQKREAEREMANLIAQRTAESLIPRRFADRRFSNYIADELGQKRALNVCRRYVDSWAEQRPKGTSLIFTGGPGTGKTHLACAIASELIEMHQTRVLFVSVTEALRRIKETYRKDSEESERVAIDSLLTPTLLILDEIGVQIGSDHEKLLLFEVLNGRYNDLQPTILLSNLSAADLEGYLGQRVMDRYRECGAVIAFDWASRRGAR
jgi:DNA replication protein DnaC